MLEHSTVIWSRTRCCNVQSNRHKELGFGAGIKPLV